MFTDTRPFDNLSADEKEHRIAEVASRLKFIGDKAVERYNTESSSSAVESPQGQGHSGRAGKLWFFFSESNELVVDIVSLLYIDYLDY